ncbi:MAG: diaminopimelate decarboxylase, partial [Desulfovibrio sp.]
MHHFPMIDGVLHAEDIPVPDLAKEYGTPLYIYSSATLRQHFEVFDSAFSGVDHITCYSVKANSNLHVLKLLKDMGAGMDIVSGGELHRALTVGVPGDHIVYSGLGKRSEEIRQALDAGILMFNIESRQELDRIDAIARSMNTKARVSLRVNPDVDPGTHPYVATGLKKSKFGLDVETSREAYLAARDMEGVEPVGIDYHIGSQLTSVDPFLEALEKVLDFSRYLADQGIDISYLDLGGGLGITYDSEEPPHPTEFGPSLTKMVKDTPLTLILEPGRVIAGNAGIMVTEVQYTKTTPANRFVVVDAAMNDLIRPSLYDSYHRIEEVEPKNRSTQSVDVVGPICESGDFLAQGRELP